MSAAQPVLCVRCAVPLLSAGIRAFRVWPDEGVTVGSEIGNWANTRLEHMMCPKCGHVEFFVPGVGADRSANEPVPDYAAPSAALPLIGNTIATDDGTLEETWMCSCGECNFLSYDNCLACNQPRQPS
jgi:hypothetical protein